jgi:hypothetical protein
MAESNNITDDFCLITCLYHVVVERNSWEKTDSLSMMIGDEMR